MKNQTTILTSLMALIFKMMKSKELSKQKKIHILKNNCCSFTTRCIKAWLTQNSISKTPMISLTKKISKNQLMKAEGIPQLKNRLSNPKKNFKKKLLKLS